MSLIEAPFLCNPLDIMRDTSIAITLFQDVTKEEDYGTYFLSLGCCMSGAKDD